MQKHTVLMIGGGAGGITVAAQLKRKKPSLDIAVIEPSENHYYQPFWTLVGGGEVTKEQSLRPQRSVIPSGVTWVKDAVQTIDPHAKKVTLVSGTELGFDYLVVAAGLQINWHGIAGLPETLGKNGVCSIYDYQQAEITWHTIKAFKGGTALFTAPSTPIKCGGAPQKIMYLAEETFAQNGVRANSTVSFVSGGGVLFAVKEIADALLQVVQRKNIALNFKHDLIAIDGASKKATFKVTDNDGNTSQKVLDFDMIHVTPPMSAPTFIQNSPLARTADPLKGWMNVDPSSLQSPDYPYIFGVGDVCGTTNAKTAAAIRKQAPVVVEGLLAQMGNGSGYKKYDGYGSCPLITGRGKLILAEFNYKNEFTPTIPLKTDKERYDMYLLKRYGLPFLYWNLMLKGLA